MRRTGGRVQPAIAVGIHASASASCRRTSRRGRGAALPAQQRRARASGRHSRRRRRRAGARRSRRAPVAPLARSKARTTSSTLWPRPVPRFAVIDRAAGRAGSAARRRGPRRGRRRGCSRARRCRRACRSRRRRPAAASRLPTATCVDVGHQVVRDAARVFADQAALVGADRVEVAQQRDRPCRVGGADRRAGCSRPSAWSRRTGWSPTAARPRGSAALGLAVDGGAGAEDQRLAAVLRHRLAQSVSRPPTLLA